MEKPMHILAIHGSPSMKRGETYLVLERLLRGAEKAGAISEVVFIQKETIRDVRGVLPVGSRLQANAFREMVWRN